MGDPGQGSAGAADEVPAASPRHTILIVKDEVNRIIYGTYLRHYRCAVLTAEEAEDGLAIAHAHCPDLIVMDVGLPGMDGNAATRLLKADSATRDIPVVTRTRTARIVTPPRRRDATCT